MAEGMEFTSAVAVRVGIVGGAVLGAFVGYWIGLRHTPADLMQAWPAVVGVIGGLVAAWVALTWVARRNPVAGVIAGGVVTAAASVALLAHFFL